MNVALLSALPHTLDAVELARRDPRRDYVRAVLQGHVRTSDEIWSKLQPVLETQANQLFNTCANNQVFVVCNAGRAELAAASAKCNLVIVLAHWKGPLVASLPSDIQAIPFTFEGPLRRWGESRQLPILEAEFEQLRILPPREARHHIASLLNRDILRWVEWLPFDDLCHGCDSAIATDSWGSNYARKLVDEHFGDTMLIPGARLELADGLWRPADLAACFPAGWSGMCDFVCCTSEYLAEETKRMRIGATFRADSHCLEPAVVFAALQEMIPRLRREPCNDGDMVGHYISIAYDCDRKYGRNTP